MIVRLPMPEFRPDLTDASGVLTVCDGVYPTVDGGYRPVKSLSSFGDALAAAPYGATSAISTDGTGYLLAGTTTALYRYTSGTWTSLVTGLTTSVRWQFTQFGDFVVAINGVTTREIDLTAGSDSAIADAPTATSIAAVGDHVVIGQPDGVINKVAWSAFRDHTGWDLGVNQAGEQPFQTGGAVQGIVGGEYGLIFQRERITRMDITGNADTPFQFSEVSTNFGCSNGATIAQSGRTVFFHSDRGFMAIEDGQALRPIGSETIDRTFEELVGRDNFGNIYSAVDPQNKLVMWGVPGTPGKLYIYNFEQNRWSTATLAFKALVAGFTSSTTLEALAVDYTDLDALTIPLDDPQWAGGNPSLYAFDGSAKPATFGGDNVAARFEFGDAEIIQGQRARIRGVRPVTDATDGLTVSFLCRNRLGDAGTLTGVSTMRDTGFMPVRCSGRYVAPRVQYDSGAVWDYMRGLEVECYVGGAR